MNLTAITGHRGRSRADRSVRGPHRRLFLEGLEHRRLMAVMQNALAFAPGEILIGLDGDLPAIFQREGKGAALKSASARFDALGLSSGEVLMDLRGGGVATSRLITRWSSGNKDLTELADMLSKLPGVAYAEPNYILSAAFLPDDSRMGELWGMHNLGQSNGTFDADIDAVEAWDMSTGSTDVIVGIIDSGIDYTHPDLAQNIWANPAETAGNGIDDDNNGYIDDVHGINSITGSGDPMDDNSHGTHVAGTIGASGNNSNGVAGVNWNVKMVGAKFLNANGSGSTADAIECFQYFNALKNAGNNIVVTNNSWGGGGFSQALMDAMAGSILHAVAAGNANNNNDASPSYPSSYALPNIISVAATDRNDRYASFSSYGLTSVDLAAPGVSIISTVPNNGYASFSGTSMATPHVAGAAALISAQYPALTAGDLKQVLLDGTDIIGGIGSNASKPTLTEGRLNVHQSLLNLSESDEIAPGVVNDLAVTSAGIVSMTLSWTAKGDDWTVDNGDVGTARAYDVRYSTSPVTESNWDAATKATGEPRPQAPGSTESFVLKGLSSDVTYYFALKVLDNRGNASGVSNVTTGKTIAGTPLFADGFENGFSQWTAQAPWGLSTSVKRSGNNSASDSPQGNYANNVNSSLTSKPIVLTDISDTQISFWHRYDLEQDFDFARFEISINGGTSWTTLATYTGTSSAFQKVSINLSAYDGKPSVMVRFRLQSDFSIRKDGWYVDDVQVVGLPIPTPRVLVSPTSGLVTSEGLKQETFSVRLNTKPSADVTIPIRSSDTTEGTLSLASLTFTAVNWDQYQFVSVFGVDDDQMDGNINYSIVLDPTTSADFAYHGLNPTDVSVVNEDNERPLDKLYFSVLVNQTIGSLAVANEDVLILDANGAVRLLFDGSDVGLTSATVNAFDVISATEILLSFDSSISITGIGTVDDSDIVLFTATRLGDETIGSFSMYFDGSDVGLTTNDEDIDAIHLLSSGKLLVSTVGSVSVPGVSAADVDLLLFDSTVLGANTAGSWSIYFDGSDVGLSDNSGEDIDAVTLDAIGRIYLSTTSSFSVPGASGADEDVFVFTPTATGATTSGTYSSSLFLDGSLLGLANNDVTGIDLPIAAVAAAESLDPAAVDLALSTDIMLSEGATDSKTRRKKLSFFEGVD